MNLLRMTFEKDTSPRLEPLPPRTGCGNPGNVEAVSGALRHETMRSQRANSTAHLALWFLRTRADYMDERRNAQVEGKCPGNPWFVLLCLGQLSVGAGSLLCDHSSVMSPFGVSIWSCFWRTLAI